MVSPTSTAPFVVYLAGIFAVGYNAAIALHECGHALGAWASGGAVDHITLHPFSWSYTYFESDPTPRLTTWAGAAVSSTLGAILVACTWRTRSARALLPVLIGIISGVQNGVYLAVDCLMDGGGDGASLAVMGTPKWLIVAIGCALALTFIGLAIPRLGMFGLGNGATLSRRIVILLGSVGPYLLAILWYQGSRNAQELTLWTIYIGLGFGMLAAMGAVAGPMISRWPALGKGDTSMIRWPEAIAAVSIATTVVIFEVCWFSR